jgi:hypothetical protein
MGILKSAGVAESIDALRRSASGGGRGGRSAQLFLKNDSSIKVRFLQEPTQFMEYLEHYDAEKKAFVPAIDNDPLDQHPDEKVRKVGKRWLANILNIEDGKVHIVKLNQDQLNRLLTRYQKYGTLLDRNYELIRMGSGRDSKYDIDNDDPTQMDLSRYQDRLHDLEEFLLGEVDEYHDTNFRQEYVEARARANGTQAEPADPPAVVTQEEIEARKAEAAAQKIAQLDEKYGEEPPWSDKDGEDTKLPPTEGSTIGGTTPPIPAPAEQPGMAEIAAETEAKKGEATPAELAAAQAISTAPALTAVPDPTPAESDPWAEAKAAGQPCVKGEDDKCVICGFNVTECLMKK